LPTLSVPAARDVAVDAPSVCPLQEHNQPILQQSVPRAVGADGNCLFRAVSLALYGHKGLYSHLRLLATIEILLFPALYDASSRDFYKPYKADDRLLLSCYDDFVQTVVKDGSYSDMLTVLAVSSVIQKPIQTRWPVVLKTGHDNAMTQLVVGRVVATAHAVNVLWTSTVASDPPNVNHFVPLIVMQPGDCLSQFYDVKQLQLQSTAATQSQCIDLTCDDADAALIERDDESDAVDDNSRRSDAAADERDTEHDDDNDGHSHPS